MKIARTLILILSFITVNSAVAQENDPYKLIESVLKRFSAVLDYQVDAKIKVDVNFLKVPEANAKITFKQPDKIKLESEGFALLPKQGLNFLPINLLKSEYSAIFVKTDSIDNHLTGIVKVIPIVDTVDIVLATLWIDIENNVIRRISTTSKSTGSMMIELNYNKKLEFALPDTVKFTFNISTFKLPAGMSVDFESSAKDKSNNSDSMKGSVIVSYSNYIINSGIKESFFEEK